MFFSNPGCSDEIPHDFDMKLEVYCHKLHEEFSVSNTPKKLRKKINDISGSVGRSVGKRLSGLVSIKYVELPISACTHDKILLYGMLFLYLKEDNSIAYVS